MTRPRQEALVIGVHPMSRGFGWIAYSGPFAPHDWRVVETKGQGKNDACLNYLAKLFDRLQPATLVLEAFEPTASGRVRRIANLGRALTALAIDQGIDVAVFTRSEVRFSFAHVGARTRQEVAEAVARHSPPLRDLLPAKRRAWDRENLKMSLFSAAAVVITHYALDANRLLDELKDVE